MRVVGVREESLAWKVKGAWASANSDPEWLRPEADSQTVQDWANLE